MTTFLETMQEVFSPAEDHETSEKLLDLKKELAEEYVQRLEKEKSDLFLSVGRDIVIDYLVDEKGIGDVFNDTLIGKAMESLSSLSSDFKNFREKLNNATTEEDLASLKNTIITNWVLSSQQNIVDKELSAQTSENIKDSSILIQEQLPYIQETLKKAESQIGKPYVWGCTTEKGFDCSGLWNWAFKQQGIDFKDRFTASLFSKTDVDIPKEQVRIWDFMFWDQRPDSKKHNPIYHIEMATSEPFEKNGKWYVKTIGSSTDKGVLDSNGNETKKWGVGYRIREITEYRHFGRPPFYLQLAEYKKTGDKAVLLASNTKVSSDIERKLVA